MGASDVVKLYYRDKSVAIIHGDCREVLPKLKRVDLVLTDPPYGVGAKYGPSYDDDRHVYWEWFLPTIELMRASGRVVAFTHRVKSLEYIRGWDWLGVWTKPYSGGARIGNSPILPHWEPIYLFGIHQIGVSDGWMADVIQCNPTGSGASKGLIGRERWQKTSEGGAAHPTPKPEPLFRRLMEGLSNVGGTILDPFMGSGTTLRAAKDLGRKAIGIEIEEKYCEIAAKRMEQSMLGLTLGSDKQKPVDKEHTWTQQTLDTS